jgi:hypothetical protein
MNMVSLRAPYRQILDRNDIPPELDLVSWLRYSSFGGSSYFSLRPSHWTTLL